MLLYIVIYFADKNFYKQNVVLDRIESYKPTTYQVIKIAHPHLLYTVNKLFNLQNKNKFLSD